MCFFYFQGDYNLLRKLFGLAATISGWMRNQPMNSNLYMANLISCGSMAIKWNLLCTHTHLKFESFIHNMLFVVCSSLAPIVFFLHIPCRPQSKAFESYFLSPIWFTVSAKSGSPKSKVGLFFISLSVYQLFVIISAANNSMNEFTVVRSILHCIPFKCAFFARWNNSQIE